jgi:hypothetical protein
MKTSPLEWQFFNLPCKNFFWLLSEEDTFRNTSTTDLAGRGYHGDGAHIWTSNYSW